MFEIGKIPPEVLERIVMDPMRKSKLKRPDVLLRPKTGEDCSAVDLGGEYCILSTDPITGAAKDIGYLAVKINCNDVYSSGAEPVGLLVTILLPPESDEALLEEIMDGVMRAAEECGAEILGGHTEVTDVVVKPVISAAVIGKTRKKKIISTGGAEVGQDVVMTKWAGLEGTAILAKDFEEGLSKIIPWERLKEAQDMKAYLSVGKESEIAFEHGATAMHDATEGGILGAVWELAECSGKGVDVYLEKIPVKDVTKEIAEAMSVDLYRLISSGTMMIASFDGEGLVRKLEAACVEAAVIGRITESGKYLIKNGKREPLGEPQKDELYTASLDKKK